MKNQLKRTFVTILTACLILACLRTPSVQIPDIPDSPGKETVQPHFHGEDDENS